ncbi:hypothetical protein GAY28_27150 [Azospirillum brasilense]|nr:hypothetical protein [Azospirillum brasilense]
MADRLDAEAQRNAKRLLKPLLVKAQVKVRSGKSPAAAFSPGAVPPAMWSFLKRSNLSGVHIYHSGAGWQADILFKTSVPGGGTIIGTDAAQGCSTREDAVEAAIDMLATVILIETGQAASAVESQSADDHLTFDLEGLPITLEPNFREAIPQAVRDIPTSEVRQTLIRYLSADFPTGVTRDAFAALPPERRGSYVGLAAVLLQRGVLEFRREDGVIAK